LEGQLAAEKKLFVARDSDVTALKNIWDQAASGDAKFVRLQGAFGGGRRALMGEFYRTVTQADDDIIVWRVNCVDQENGLQWLIRMYGSLIGTLGENVLRRGRAEMVLNSQLPNQPQRVQSWYQEFISALKDSKTDKESGQIQLRMPKDNPLLGLVEIANGLARRIPIVLEIQNPNLVYSVALAQFVEAMMVESASEDTKLMMVLFDEPESERTQSLFPVPLLDMYGRRDDEFVVHPIEPWGAEETAAYLASAGIEGNAAELARLGSGRPGFIAELTDIFSTDGVITQELAGTTLSEFIPMAVDESELELPAEPAAEGERKHAGPQDLDQVAFFAALLGQAFPAAIVADMGGYDRESIDDLLDAAGDLFEEVQFSKELGTWIYRFKKGTWRQAVLEAHRTEEGMELARRAGMFMERFLVPRGSAFTTKTARIYAENGAPDRASMLRAMALSQDANDVWGLCFDLVKYFDEVEWPDALVRTLYMNLLDNLVGSGPVNAAEKVHQDATEWATTRQDKDMIAWLCFAGSKLDTRRQDFYRAKDRADDALKLYNALENGQKCAEIHNHIAAIMLQDGKPEEAIQAVNKAIEVGQIDGPDGQKVLTPPVFAHAEQIRGLIARRSGDPKQATQHFRNANEAAGRAGIAILALDSGLAFGEALLASGEVDQAQEALDRVVQIARQLKNPMRERNACELAAQAQGATRNWEKAIQYAGRTLELTQGLKFTQAMPVDLHNLGFFLLAAGKVKEALPYLNQAESGLAGLGNHPVVKECHYFTGMAKAQTGDLEGAKSSFTNALPHLEGHNDWPKFVAAKSNLAGIAAQGGDKAAAKTLMEEAIATAETHGLKNEKKELKKRLASLQ